MQKEDGMDSLGKECYFFQFNFVYQTSTLKAQERCLLPVTIIIKVTHCIITVTLSVQNRQIHRGRKQVSGCQGMGEGKNWK